MKSLDSGVMWKLLLLLPLTMLLLSCGYRKPATHDPVVRSYPELSREVALNELVEVLSQEAIPIKSKDLARGLIVSDSFEVATEYCDCGKNLLGAEYPGTRRGVLKVHVKQDDRIAISFEFETRLVIRANNMVVICPSQGILEEKILWHFEQRTGVSGGKADD